LCAVCVSTGRQAESDLSIPDQRRQITAYCVAKGLDVAAEFVEPGNTDDRRPAFQAMIDAAFVKPPTFTIIIVHSFSASSAINSSSNSTSAIWPRMAGG
jgi:DNA invertase Pin-like site-specific DNA recombinase